MTRDPARPARGLATFNARGERLLRRAPRALEVVCALPLVVIALMLLYGVAVYVRIQQYYGRNLGEKASDWLFFFIQALSGAGILGLAVNLMRGTSSRPDGGLLSPGALRTWGVVFALVPLGLLLVSPHMLLHFFALFWSASAACFLLAKRRPRAEPEPDRPIE